MPSSPFQGRHGSPTDISVRFYDATGALGFPICISTPIDPVLNKGIGLTQVMAPSPTGENGLADQFATEVNPSLQFSLPVFNPVSVGMGEGMAPEKVIAPSSTFVIWAPRLITQQFYPAATAGQEGFGVISSPVGAKGGTLTADGIPEELIMTGVYTANTAPTGTNTVAIGANMGLSFSADVVGKYAAMVIPNNLAGVIRLKETLPWERCEINICGQTRNQQRWHLKIPEALLNPSEGSIPLGAEQKIDLNYTILTAGRCQPYEWEWLPQQRVC